VADIVGSLLRKRGLTGKVEAASVVPEWAELMGPQITAVTRPLRVSDGVLFVAVTSSPWMMELNLMKADLMRRINTGKREGRIKQLVLVMAEK
jgi:predicted nucleic acid-binding Zn ribbon protein